MLLRYPIRLIIHTPKTIYYSLNYETILKRKGYTSILSADFLSAHSVLYDYFMPSKLLDIFILSV